MFKKEKRSSNAANILNVKYRENLKFKMDFLKMTNPTRLRSLKK